MITIRHVVCDRESYFVKDTASAMDAAEYMADRKIGAVCVLDAGEKLCGIFSERDLLQRVVVRKLVLIRRQRHQARREPWRSETQSSRHT